MQLISCSGTWLTSAEGYLSCSGTLSVVTDADLGQSAMTTEDVQELTGHALVLFAVVFGILALKKALT